MKPLPLPLTVCLRATAVLAVLLPFVTSVAQGQVSVDMRALDGPRSTQPAPARRQSAPRTPTAPVHRDTTANSTAPRANQPSSVTDDRTQPTATPAATPPLPTQQPAPPPASTIVPNPATSPLPLPPPVRLVFEAGKSDLTPADEAAIQDLARAIPTPAADSVNVLAYAAGKPDDPSTARRLSLSRGLAVRTVLLASGIPSEHIYVRALGSTPSDGPADRVELTVAPIGTVTR